MPHVWSSAVDLVNAYRSGSLTQLVEYLKVAAYENAQYTNIHGVDSFVDRVPLRTGFATIDQMLAAPLPNGARN
jgi:hypothetical protein